MKKRCIKLLSVTLAVSSVLSIGLLTAKPTLRADVNEFEDVVTVDASLPVDLVVSIAKSQVGYCEKKSNKSLYDKKANKGIKNYTKYAYEFDHYFKTFYNGKKQKADWCDIFVDWCFVTAFGETAGRKALYQPKKSAGAGANSSMNYYKKKDGKKDSNGKKINSWSKTPKVGDQVFFSSSKGGKKATHTGLVIDVSKNSITVVEGNSGRSKNPYKVVKSTIKKSSDRYKKIIGFGHPNYSNRSANKTLSFVQNLYKNAINTTIAADTKFQYSNRLACGNMTGAYLVKAVFESKQMEDLLLSNEDYINKITSVLFGREATEEEMQHWLGALETGTATRHEVLKGFVNSDEFVAVCKKNSIKKAGTIA